MIEAVVDDRIVVADGVVALDLCDSLGSRLPAWSPGAHIDVYLPTGDCRQYSLCSDPVDRQRYRIAVLREPRSRGGSQYLNERVGTGDRLTIGPPRNNFPLVGAERYLFVAGGIGITPLYPMIHAVRSSGGDWRLLYGGRTRASMAFSRELLSLGDRVTLCPEDEFGLLDLVTELDAVDSGCHIYCCGPEGLLQAIEQQSRERDLVDRLHLERFSPRSDALVGERHAFDVVLRRSGLTLRVPPDRSILDVLFDAGIDVPSSCEEGTCGTCETRILAGRADHRDSVLDPAEQAANDTMMICVSRSASEVIVLDV